MQLQSPPETEILLCTLNAKYIHSAFGLRYLQANLGALEERSHIQEFTILDDPLQIVETILQAKPKIIGFGVYIWNVVETEIVIGLLKSTHPEIPIVIGGPEVSHEWERQSIVNIADFLVTGEGEVTFAKLCTEILSGSPPPKKVHFGELPDVATLTLPYHLYSDHDVQNRILYVEASRGCPFKCQFCLSSLDKKVRNFDLDRLLEAFDQLIDRGAKQFKFVDRTFNLKVNTSIAILQYFLNKLTVHPDIFLHFEMVPDRFPIELREYVAQFPAGQIQFEIGIQTFNPDVAARIQRRQDYKALEDNLDFLHSTGVHLHTDLIIGLPGENIDSFAKGFDYLLSLGVEEIQVGILKRLNGAPISMHTAEWKQVYTTFPPYEIIQNSVLSFETLARLRRFARYWNIIGNSGRFNNTLLYFKEKDSPFQCFLQFSDWLYQTCGRTYKISYNNMLAYLQQFAHSIDNNIDDLLIKDFQITTGKMHTPSFLQQKNSEPIDKSNKNTHSKRQQAHNNQRSYTSSQ